MKWFLFYTAARAGVFAVMWALVLLVTMAWLEWDPTTALWTALIALVLTAPVSLVVLAPLRDRFTADLATRSERMQRSFREARSKEDPDAQG